MEAGTDLNPGQILEISGYYWKTCTLHAAVKLGVFTEIGEAGGSAEEISGRMQVDRRSLEMLLNALAAMKLVAKTGVRYANAPLASKFLRKDSPDYLGYMIMHHHHLVDSWAQLDIAVKTGRPVRSKVSHSEGEKRESFLMGMFNLAMSIAPQVAGLIDLSSRRHLLDLGGGPGTYAIQFCLRNPQLRATVYDLATTEPFAVKTIEKFNLKERIAFQPGDYLEEGIGGKFDVAWLSHILHGEGPEACQMIVEKVVGALEPGGLIFIHEFILDDSMDNPLFPALFSLNMLLGTPDGQSYSEGELRTMLSQAGAKNIRRLSFKGPNESGILGGEV